LKITNKLGLPQALYDAVAQDPYSSGDAEISITGLIAPPRIRMLRKWHDALIEEDVSDRIYSLLGQVMHSILERANRSALAERRFFMDVEGIPGQKPWRVSGAMDAILEEGILQDYKLLSYHKISGGVPHEFEEQLNCYAALLKHGKDKDGKTLSEIMGKDIEIKQLQLICIFRDWSKGKADHNELMPQQQGLKLDVMKWTDEDAMTFLKERVTAHQKAETILPECTDEEIWKRPNRWAVMPRRGAARAIKVHATKEDAEKHIKTLKSLDPMSRPFLEDRIGEAVRCKSWCNVSPWCEQYQKTLKKD